MPAGKRSDDAAMEPGSARFLFRSFRRILACNTAALEAMARMDRAMGGEYVFDAAYLQSAVREICRHTHLTTYHVNGMADEGYVALYDAFLTVKDVLEDILAGGMGPLAGHRALTFAEIGWELEPLVGLAAAGLAVLGRSLGAAALDGLAVTTTGMAALADPRAETAQAARAAVEAAVAALFARLGGARLIDATLVAAGADGAGETLAAAAGTPADLARIIADWAGGVGRGRAVAVCLRPRLAGRLSGTLVTLARDPSLPPAMLVVAPAGLALADTPGAGPDRLWIARAAPHMPLRSRLAAKGVDAVLPGGAPLDPAGRRALRGSAWLLPAQAAALAELGLAAERAVGAPCRLSWVLGRDGRLRLTDIEPAPVDLAGDPDGLGDDMAGLDPPGEEDVLLAGGQMACGGVAAGPTVLLDEDAPTESVPLGAVGLAKTASPALSRFVPRLGALVAEVGSPASHLAAIAREYRTPAVFGLPGAASLPAGVLVTLDAEAAVLYRGAAEGLLRQAAASGAALASEPEYLTLRRLLRHIRPLSLTDPEAPDFDAAHCRTCPDIIHFAHETAVSLLLDMGAAGRKGLGTARRLREPAPFPLSLVDLGGGLAGDGGPVALDEVTSRPLAAFLAGLLAPETWRPGPSRLGLGDIVAGLDRTARAMAAVSGDSLALAGTDYAHITLRLGYHFSVVDALVTDRPEHNALYFRFAGGFADGDRRARRADMLAAVLSRLEFRLTRQGDLVVGRRRLIEAEEALAVLRVLGALTAYTRQLDVELSNDAEAARLAREFLALAGVDDAGGERR